MGLVSDGVLPLFDNGVKKRQRVGWHAAFMRGNGELLFSLPSENLCCITFDELFQTNLHERDNYRS